MAAHQKARPPSEGGAGRKAASGQARREDITSAAIGREPAPNPCHAAAIEHIEAGRPVMPVNPTSKRPLLASWRHLQDRLPTAEELEDWFTTWPGAGLALITGKLSGVVVVDLDLYKVAAAERPAFLAKVNSRWGQSPLTARTQRGGEHRYFASPTGAEVTSQNGQEMQFVDVKSRGGYVLVPPSMGYEWLRQDADFDDLPEYVPAARAEEFDTLLRDRPKLTEGVAEGSRNATAASLAGKLLAEGKCAEEVLVFLQGWNLKNSPPLEDAELRWIVESVVKTDARNHPEGHGLLATIARLAALTPLEYDLVRKAEAHELGMRVGTLDAAVKAARPAEEKTGGMVFPEVTPWPEPVDGAALFSEIAATVRRFVVCEPEVAIAAALWCAMTWLMDVVDVAPLLHLKSPVERCGKTALLTLLTSLVSRPIPVSNISPSAFFRAIEAWAPTLLIDEVDAFLKEKEELRGVLDSGHTRGASYVVRCEGDDFTPRQFSTWGAKLLAGIGNLASTIEDRAIILEMRRKRPSEKVERLRHVEPGLFDELQSRLARWCDDHREEIRRARPELPEELHDRAQDNWEPVLAIADAAGGDWPKVARAAALALSGKEPETASVGVELLVDIRTVFDGAGWLSTADLIEKLTADTERRWASYYRGAPITPRQLAAKLRPFGVRSKSVGPRTSRLKGFDREQFAEAFSRYLPPLSPDPPVLSAHPLTRNENNGLLDFSSAHGGGGCADRNQPNPLGNKEVSGCADRIPPPEQRGVSGAEHRGNRPPTRTRCRPPRSARGGTP